MALGPNKQSIQMKKINYFLTRLSIIGFCFFIISSFSSCRKDITPVNAPQNYTGNNFSDVFESFWNGMNNNYVFWSIDSTNWDRVYTTYKPLFAKLNLLDTTDNNTALNYFQQMTAGLIDSHYTLTYVGYNNQQFSPSFDRKLKINSITPDSIYSLPQAMFDSLIPLKYIDPSSLKKGLDSVTQNGSTSAFEAVSGTIQNKILYLYFNSFSFTQTGPNVSPVLNYFFDTLAKLPPSIKGIVIDVRGNGGGEIVDLDYLLGSMITKPLTFGYTRSKNGNGRLDYTPWAPAIVTPQQGAVAIALPIVVLADHTSVSMAEITAMAIKSLPNGKFIGTTTWGANGPLAPAVYYNAGQFTAGSYVNVYTSSTMFKYLDGNIYEGKGVPPDIFVKETSAAYHSGDDQQLDAAINYINNH